MPPESDPLFRIEPLAERHDRAAFSCGVEALDSYLRKQAGQDVRKRVAAVFVAAVNGIAVAGYYTLSQSAIHLDAVPPEIARKLPRYPMIPVTLIGRLAVSASFRGRRIGETLLMDALYRSLRLSRQAASIGVIVDAKEDALISFYAKFGFLPLPGLARRLLLPMRTIEQLLR